MNLLSTILIQLTLQQGAKYCVKDKKICFSAEQQESDQQILYTIESTNDVGYVALGKGTSMANSNMTIVWLNKNGQPVISDRIATGHSMPNIIMPQISKLSTPKVPLEMQAEKSETSPTIKRRHNGEHHDHPTEEVKFDGQPFTVAFTRPLTEHSDYIFAYSKLKPESDEIDAKIGYHNSFGAFKMFLNNGTSEISDPQPEEGHNGHSHGVVTNSTKEDSSSSKNSVSLAMLGLLLVF